jgi:hypothetical protein
MYMQLKLEYFLDVFGDVGIPRRHKGSFEQSPGGWNEGQESDTPDTPGVEKESWPEKKYLVHDLLMTVDTRLRKRPR